MMKKTKNYILLIIAVILFIIILPFTSIKSGSFEKAKLTIRFDDGYETQLKAVNTLRENGLTASFFVITDKLGETSYVQWIDVQRLQKQGFEIGSHSKTHRNMLFLLSGSHREELVQSKEELRQMGINVNVFAYPYGIYNYKFLDQVKQEYECAGIYNFPGKGLNYPNTNKYKIKCKEFDSAEEFEASLKKAVEKKAWLVACFHRIDEEEGKYKIDEYEFRKIVMIAKKYQDEKLIDVIGFEEGCSGLE